MPFCSNCGYKMNDSDRFCAKCGTPIKEDLSSPIVSSTNNMSDSEVLSLAQDIKNSLSGIYGLLDTIETKVPKSVFAQTKLKEMYRLELFMFMLCLSAANNTITTLEKDVMNIIFDYNMSVQDYVQFISDKQEMLNKFKEDTSYTFQIVAEFDAFLIENGLNNSTATPLLMKIFKIAGNTVIAINGDSDIKGETFFNTYINRINDYVTSITGKSCLDTEPTSITESKSKVDFVENNTNSYPPSIYKVGVDIPAGSYKVFSNTYDIAYYSLCNDPNGDDIVQNDNFVNQAYISIHNGQYLELCDCYAVPLKDATLFKGTQYTDGEYIVGSEIAPGEYKVRAYSSDEDGYYSLETFAADGSRNIDSNRTFDNIAYVALKQGQILVLKDCILSL